MRAVVGLLGSLALVSGNVHHSDLNSHHVNKSSPYTPAELETLFSRFVKTFDKKYTSDEFFSRYHIFSNNVERIRSHNAKGHATYSMGVNEFADQSWDEFKAARLGFLNRDMSVLRAANTEQQHHAHHRVHVAAGASVDWRTKGIVTPVKNQGQCGSCWAFSTTGSTEAAHAQKTGKLVSLSEQQLVDCSSSYGNQGCNGGLMDDAFQYIIANGGITSEANYAYTAADGTCNSAKAKQTFATLSSFKDVAASDESALLTAVNGRPVSVAVEADQDGWQFYTSGILSSDCGNALDHGVLVVGYGTDSSTDYWLVKNSWGASWGENGYIRIKRGLDLCGIADSASYPIA